MRKPISRRRFAISAGSIGALSLAGCLGGDSDTETVTIGTASSSGSTYGYTQALQRAVSQHGDGVQVSTQETSGMASNPYLIKEDQVNGMTSTTHTALQAMDEEGNFADDPVSEFALQAFNVSMAYMAPMAVNGSGIETTDDFPGANFWPLPPGFSTRALTEDVVRYTGYWEDMEIHNLETSDIADAVSEGRVEVFFAYGWNSQAPAWLREIDNRAELHAVEMVGDFRQQAQEYPGAGWDEGREVTDMEQDIGADELDSFTMPTNYWFDESVSSDAVYEIMRVSLEHNDTVREGDPGYGEHENAEDMFIGFNEELPFHPGAAEFYQEHDVWDDSYETSEENYQF